MNAEARAVRSVGDLAFVLGFTAYLCVAVLLLLGGLRTLFAGEVAVTAPQALVDYAVSAANIALGVVLVWLRPRNTTARLLGVGMVGTAAAFNLSTHGLFYDLAESWVNLLHFLLHATSAVAYLHALLLFPDGRLPGRWARRLLVAVYGAAGLEVAIMLLFGVRVEGAGPVSVLALLSAAPFGIGEAIAQGDRAVIEVADVIAADGSFFVLFFGVLVPLVGLVGQLQRYRSASSALERQQSRLLAWALTAALAGGVLFVAYAVASGVAGATGFSVSALATVEGWAFRVFPLLFAVLPVALFTGILRYGLWDIDRAINRALVYGLLTGILGLAYLAIVTVLGLLVAFLGAQRLGDFVIGLAMLAVAGLFRPVRRRVQDTIDRRFYRRRYDAARTLQTLSAQLREEVDRRRVADDVLDAVEHTVEPAHASLWLRS